MRDTPILRSSRILFKLLAYRPPAVDVPPQGAVPTRVNIVNPARDRLSGQTLVVHGDRIDRISPSKPEDTDGNRDDPHAGAYVLPGLVDMHVHVPPLNRELEGRRQEWRMFAWSILPQVALMPMPAGCFRFDGR